MYAKTVREAVAARVDVRPVQDAVTRALHAVGRRVARDLVARVARRALRMVVVAMTSLLRRTAMIAQREDQVAVIAVARVDPMRASRVRIRRVRTIRVHRVTQVQANRMDRAVRRVRLAPQVMQAIPPNSAAGTYPRASTPDHARVAPAVIPMRRVSIKVGPAPAVRVVPVDMAHRAVQASMRAGTNNARSHHAHMAIAHVVIVHTTARRVAPMLALLVTVRRVPVQVAVAPNTSIEAPAARRRMRARTAHARIDPAPRAVHVTKGCRATRIDQAARSGAASIGWTD